MNIIKAVGRYLRERRALAAMEYALIVGTLIVGLSAALVTFNTEIKNFISTAGSELTSVTPTSGP